MKGQQELTIHLGHFMEASYVLICHPWILIVHRFYCNDLVDNV